MPAPTPIEMAIARLTHEAQYVADVLHVAGPAPTCTVSTRSLRGLFDGIREALDLLRAAAPAPPPATSAPLPQPQQTPGG